MTLLSSLWQQWSAYVIRKRSRIELHGDDWLGESNTRAGRLSRISNLGIYRVNGVR